MKLELVGECVVDGDFIGIALQGDHAYLLAEDRLVVMDISDPHGPMQTGSVDAPVGSEWRKGFYSTANSGDFALLNGFAYVFDYSGLQVIDVHDPAHPTLATHIESYGSNSGKVVSVGSRVIWFVYCEAGFWYGDYSIIDITDSEEPQELLRLNERLGCVHWIAPDFPRLYIGGHNWADDDAEGSGVRIYDISDLSNPVFWGQTKDAPYADEILPNGSHLYCAGGYGFGPVYFRICVSLCERRLQSIGCVS